MPSIGVGGPSAAVSNGGGGVYGQFITHQSSRPASAASSQQVGAFRDSIPLSNFRVCVGIMQSETGTHF